MNKVLVVIISFVLCIVAGCSSTPDGVYSEGDMEDILYDYYKAKAMGSNLPSGQEYKAALYIQSVFRKHNTSEAEFDSSLVWYTAHPDQFMDVYKKVDARLGDDLKEFAGSGGNALAGNLPALQGDTTELWNAARFCLLSNTLFSHRMNFYMEADSTFHEEDRFAWSFVAHLPGSGAGGGSMTAALCIRYANDSIIGTVQSVYSSGPVMLMLDATPHLKIKAVYGFIYKSGGENGDTSMPYSLALLDHFSLLRQHKQLPKMGSGGNVDRDSSVASVDSSKKADSTVSRARPVKAVEAVELKGMRLRKALKQ